MRSADSNVVEAEKPTIAHFLPWDGIGGVEIATLRIIEATRDQFRHVAFCKPTALELKDACEKAGVVVVSYVPPEPSVRHALRYFKQSLTVAREMKRLGVNLAHCSETKATYHNSLAAFLARVPMITHVRSRYPEIGLRDRLGFLGVAGYVFVSQDSRRQFALRIPDAKARVLYDAVDITEPQKASVSKTLRKELGVAEGATLVGMIARVNPQKDYDTLANAAALVLAHRTDVQFLVVGDNSVVEMNREHYRHVHKRLVDLGIADRFIFTGFRSDVPRIVSALDLFVLCTHREGLPLSILEAMALGKTVIATRVDGIPEVITDGVTGYLHGHEKSDELANAILKCIEHPDLAKKVGDAAREHCRRTYNSQVFTANVAQIYREFLPS
ncbi:glycosyltransferase [Tunturiibacter gelidoferens]|uniref:Glycosyltransferase involved in cell wall biosynthesis n=1 Tax=Tunturiibacter gelidiferens TaxID=3069689 RepID=A0ACC5NZ44_9BACT|nr:glycosyltransferase [Edaphobacter lichenicola]MBB5339838.1 glycosyltransferase involved in cell wall biosynthesis [Edaphobacter lichenicola]